jgi:hypothetical protein
MVGPTMARFGCAKARQVGRVGGQPIQVFAQGIPLHVPILAEKDSRFDGQNLRFTISLQRRLRDAPLS